MNAFEIETDRMFALCDRENKGYLTANDLKAVCPQLDDMDIEFIFASLDSDGSGRIEKQEFISSFQDVLRKGENEGFHGMKRRASVFESNCAGYVTCQGSETYVLNEILSESEKEDDLWKKRIRSEDVYHSDSDSNRMEITLPCQDDILHFYEELQSTGTPDLLYRFEKIVGNLCSEMKDQKEENKRLQGIYQSERELYNKKMLEVEFEMDQQLAQTERKAREEERRRLTHEKEEMRKRMEMELSDLKANITKMEKLERVIRKESSKGGQTDELKRKLQELAIENQQLKSNLADSNIELAVIKSELANVKADYETKREELLSDNEMIIYTAKQTENLQKQLQLLYDANRKLHDTNDALREALDQRTLAFRQLDTRAQSSFLGQEDSVLSLQEARLGTASNITSGDEDADSGLSMGMKYDGYYTNDRDISPFDSSKLNNMNAFGEPNGPPERTFRVVMCGEASVGKSSLVMRIIKNCFTGNIPSTLGVDFHVKNTRIDGKNVAIQLWDTAGQERFRSLCKSYFRRADGAILVYDCMVEKTFLRVREWIETIKESTSKPIPILICGNKIDLRDTSSNSTSHCVSKNDGETMAAAMGVMFAECSALDGSNVEEALLNLTRELMTMEEVEIRGTGVVLSPKQSNSSCCYRR